MSGFFAGLAVIVGVVVLLLLEATGLYVAGRIVLPELGFQPLEYGTIAWAVIWIGVFSAPIYLLKGLFDKL